MKFPLARPSRLLLPMTFLAFVSIGLPDGVLGVAWPSVRHTFGLPVSQLGSLLLSGTLGYLVSTFNSGQIIHRIGVGRLLVTSGILVALSAAAYALAPAWWVMVGFAFVAGLGSGAIDGGLNVYAARHFSPRVVNWMHACYGIGAMLGPSVMTGILVANLSWRWGYATVAAVLGIMALCFLLTLRLWETDNNAPGETAARVSAAVALRRPLVWAHVALFFVYTGVEATAGQWAYSLFTESRGMSTKAAGTAAAMFWASLTVGRIVIGQAAARIDSDLILRIAMLLLPLSAALIWIDVNDALSIAGLLLLGFACAPIFPLLISRTPARLGDGFATHAIGFQVAAAYLGIAGIPGLSGVLARRAGLEVIPVVIVVSSLVLLLLHELVMRSLNSKTFATDGAPTSAD